ncbi:MAG TPA: leucine--tRNA ligase [Myxococcales bacterium]|nr:leucine--tRNA ligase [Myxococcales bacterium]
MQDRYDPTPIESRWQQHWGDAGVFRAGARPGAPKKYVLAMLPYPSGEMHMGHARVYCITDVLARYARKRGFDVLHPFGWDSFGLPAENAAIKEGVHPALRTPKNIKSFKEDVISLGISIDWSTEIATSDPAYYRWNQWFFLRMLERGLVYRRRAKVNFCPSCNTVLANEQVEEGRCWRCGSVVVEREIPEWAFRITAYADKLLEGLNRIDWPERVVAMQRNWIGRSDGLEIEFSIPRARGKAFRVFTTRADTIYGATYVAAAPDHPLVVELAPEGKKAELKEFADKVRRAAKEMGEGAAAAEKEGLDTGIRARNPFTGEEVPVWVANFVLAGYGTGAVMAVPAHDQRDYEFAVKYGLPISRVVRPWDAEADGPAGGRAEAAGRSIGDESDLPEGRAYTDYGVLFDSGEFSGMPSEQARLAIAAEAQRRGIGKPAVNYHLRDWGVSRQRYWGTPIPIVYCPKDDPEGKGIPVPDDQLPVTLPDIDVKEVLTGVGEPPLAKVTSWVNTRCPKCGGPARREAETMDTFVDSTWYWARYLDPRNDKEPFSRARADRWLPIDVYVGGPEHAVLHLLYFRFWTKVMQELGLCAIDEPAQKLVTQGIVKGRDGEKMSKSKGNVVSPREIISEFGADTARLFILFAAPAEKDMDWSDEQVQGQHRFLGRIWRLVHGSLQKIASAKVGSDGAADELRRRTHKTILKVTQQLERLQFNTAISSLMELSNAASDWTGDAGSLRECLEVLVQLLAPFAPHVCCELWRELGRTEELAVLHWPEAEPALVVDDAYQIAVQVNGKLRGEVQVAASADETDIRETAARDPKISGWLQGKTIKKVVVIPKRLVNFVVA